MQTVRGIKENILNATILVALLFFISAQAHANVTARPSAVSFGSLTVGTVSAPVTVTLNNTNRRSTTISSVSVSGSQFSYSGPSMPVTLSDGKSLTATVQFAPGAAQAYSGSLVFESSNGSKMTVTLSGTGIQAGVAPAITTQPSSQTITAGQTATFNVAATGTAPMTYQWQMNGSAISGATSSSYTTPAETTSNTNAKFTVTLTNSAGSTTSNAAILTVNAATTYTINATPASLSFSVQAGAAASTQSIIINDTTPGPLPFTLSANQPWITMSATSGNTAGGGETMQFGVNPAGLAAGTYSGDVYLTASGAANSPQAVPITLTVTSSTVVAPAITSQPSSQTVTAGQTATFSVAATGTAPMTYQWQMNGTAISGATSSTYTTPAETATNNNAKFTAVVTNAAGSATSTAATLTVNAATLALNASSTALSFGNVNESSSSNLNVTLTNAGNSNVTVSGVSVSGAGFNASGVSTGLILTPGQTATLTVTFNPSAAGSVTGSVAVASNATNSPDTITLSGTGVAVTSYSVALSWTASTSTVTGYNMYSSKTSGGPYTKLTATPVAATTYTDSTVQAGDSYYYVVTSVNSAGIESSESNQVTAVVP